MARMTRSLAALLSVAVLGLAAQTATADGIEGKSYRYETSEGHTGCAVFDPGGLLRFDVLDPDESTPYGVHGTWTQFRYRRHIFFHGSFTIGETLYHYVGSVNRLGTVRGAVRDDGDYCLSYTAIEQETPCEPVPPEEE